MSNLDIALEYLRCFCAADQEGLAKTLHPELQFTGPLFRFSSAMDYLQSLSDGNLRPCEYRLLEAATASQAVILFYDYQKARGGIPVAQLFRFSEGLIVETHVVFDSAALR